MGNFNPHDLLGKVVLFFNADLWIRAGGDMPDNNACFWQLGEVVGINTPNGDNLSVHNTADIQYLCPISGEIKISNGHFITGLKFSKALGSWIN